MRPLLIAAAAQNDPLAPVFAIAFGAAGWWGGRKTWRGQLHPIESRLEQRQGRPLVTLWGTARQYRSRAGVAHVGLVAGPGFVLIGMAEGLRLVAGQDRGWWLYWVVGCLGAALALVSAIYVLVYAWFGVPDRLRPPCQRGWEIVDGELMLVRPEVFHEHPQHSSARVARRTVDGPPG